MPFSVGGSRAAGGAAAGPDGAAPVRGEPEPASQLLLLEVPARVVMEMLGYSGYQLTMSTCSHLAPELDSEAARLMARGAGGQRRSAGVRAAADPSRPRTCRSDGVREVVRGGIEPPTPRFSGVCSTS